MNGDGLAKCRHWLLGGVAAAALGLGGVAAAQDDVRLQEVVIEGGGQAEEESATGPVKGYAASATTTGSKTATPINEVPQAVSVLGREEIDDRGAQKVDEALRYTAGVLAQPFGPDSDTNWIFIRGFQATQTGIFQDGLQNFSYSFGGFFIDSFLLERIEVLKGPASVLYGGSNPGGIVNYVSKRPTEDAFRYLEFGVDSFGTGYGGFDIDSAEAAVGGGTVDYRMTGRLYGGEGYTDFSDQLLGVISPSLTWRPDEATSLTLLANYTHLDKTHDGGSFLPYVGTVVDAPFGRIDRDFNYTEPDLDEYDREQGSIGYEFAHTFDNDWTARQNARYGHAEISEVALYPFGYNPFSPVPIGGDTSLSRINFAHDSVVDTFLLDNQIEGEFVTGPVGHTLLAGVDYKFFTLDQIQESSIGTPIDVEDPHYGDPQPGRVPYLDEIDTLNQIGFYAQDQLRFADGWLVTLNGRYDRVWTEVDSRLVDDLQGEQGALSGRAGIAYEFANGLTPYASAATFFNPLIGSDIRGELFEPETGQQVEAGLKYVPTGFDGVFTLSVFDITRQNVQSTVAGSFLQDQTGEVNSRGVEFEAKADLTANWQALASLTVLDVEITEDNNEAIVGNQPFLVPDVLAAAFLEYTFHGDRLDGLSIGAGVRYQGESFADNENKLEVPDFALLDAKIGYEKNSWGVDLVVTNLLDEEYVASCQTQFVCSYGEARKALLKAHVTW